MGKRVIVWYPESKDSMSTQYPRKIEHYVLATTEIEPEINELRTHDISTPKTPNNSISTESRGSRHLSYQDKNALMSFLDTNVYVRSDLMVHNNWTV